MKKLFLTLSIVATLAFTSCDNDNAVNPQPLGKATITGNVSAEFDYTNNEDGDTRNAVASKKIVVAIEDWDGNMRYTETTTDANGNYTVEVEVGNRSLDVTLTVEDFRADVKESDDVTESTIFEGKTITINNVVKGGSYIRDLEY
jgi:hypothetical protein